MESGIYVVEGVFCEVFALEVDFLVVGAPEFDHASRFDTGYLVNGFHSFRIG